jgi:hypothetical protein
MAERPLNDKANGSVMKQLLRAMTVKENHTGPGVDAVDAAIDLLTKDAAPDKLAALLVLIRAAAIKALDEGWTETWTTGKPGSLYDFDKVVLDFCYTTRRKTFLSRTDAVKILTDEINGLRRIRREAAKDGDPEQHLPPLTDTSETIVRWIKEFDNRDDHKWPRGGNRRNTVMT